MEFLFAIVFISVVVWAVVHSIKQRAAAKETWAEVARARGLSYLAGGSFSNPSMRGEVAGWRVSVDTVTRGGGKSNKTYTRYRVQYPKLGVGIRLTREVPLVSTLGKMFGGQDHETGDQQFDDKVVVRAPNEKRALEYLTETRRRAIEKFLSSHKNAVITEGAATFETLGLETRAAALARGLDLLAGLADALAPRAADGVRAEAADVAAALGAAVSSRAEEEDDADDWTLPEPPTPPAVEEPAPRSSLSNDDLVPEDAPPEEPAPPADPAPPPVDVPAIASAPIAIGSAPELPAAPRISPDAAEPAAVPAHARQQEVCAALFDVGDGTLSHTQDVFAAEYDGLFVHWTGTLKSARHYYSDMKFGSEPGTRAEVVVARVASGILGEREILAVVQLPDGAETTLAKHVDAEITFEGDLLAVDPFMRQIFVRNAAVVS